MRVVVISHNQRQHIAPMLAALRGHEVCYVLDRCTDGSEEELVGITHIVNDRGHGFLAGVMRDLGAWCFGYRGPILFLDGDRIPQGPLPDFDAMGFDCVGLLCEEDQRDPSFIWQNKLNMHNFLYSCGVWLSQRVIDAARAECNGSIFHSAFDGYWGEEDRFLGDCIAKHGLTQGFTDQPRLRGSVGGIPEHRQDDFSRNFLLRLKLRKGFFNS